MKHEHAFWKQKIKELEQRRVEDTQRLYALEASQPRRKRIIRDADQYTHIENVWLDNEFDVVDVSFDKGQGEIRYSEYTTDFDDDSYRIECIWRTGKYTGQSATYCYILDGEDFSSLLSEALSFSPEKGIKMETLKVGNRLKNRGGHDLGLIIRRHGNHLLLLTNVGKYMHCVLENGKPKTMNYIAANFVAAEKRFFAETVFEKDEEEVNS